MNIFSEHFYFKNVDFQIKYVKNISFFFRIKRIGIRNVDPFIFQLKNIYNEIMEIRSLKLEI